MKMLIAALIGGAVVGFVDAQFLMTKISGMFTDPGMQGMATCGVAAFLGVLWGWIAKGMLGDRAKD